MAEMNGEVYVENTPVGLATKVWATDTGELIFDPSIEDKRYPFMPTVAEVLVGYCIQSDLEVPEEVLGTLPGDLRKFVEEKWHLDKLKERKMQYNRNGIVMKGNSSYVGVFVMEALRSKGVDAAGDVLAYGIFQRPILAVAGDSDLQKSLEKRLPVDLKGILGKEGFSKNLLPY